MAHLLPLMFAVCAVADASACSCITRTTLDEQFSHARYVFVGRVLSREEIASRDEPKGRPGVVAKFQLLEVLKAKHPPTPKVVTGVGSGDCGVPIFLGMSYVFFVGPQGEIDICSGTRPYVRGNEDLERYLAEVRSLAKKNSP